MTIKQQGGVFGRNPTFNNVEVDGTATLDSIASNTKLRVTASDNPAAYIEFENTFQNAGVASQSGLLLGVNSSVQTNYAGVIATENANNSNAVRLGLYSNNGAGPILVAEALNSKDFKIADGNLVIGTSGKGIDFSATSGTGTSELFDDYEEGTYTIEAYDATSGGNQSSTTATGYYTKIGRQVFVTGILNNINTTGLTSGNNVYISLPFASSSSLSAFHPSPVALNDIDFNTGTAPFLRLSPGTSFAVLAANKNDAAPVNITWGNLNTGAATSDVTIAVTYFV